MLRNRVAPALLLTFGLLASACGGGDDQSAARDLCEAQHGVGNCVSRHDNWVPLAAATTTTDVTTAPTTAPPTSATTVVIQQTTVATRPASGSPTPTQGKAVQATGRNPDVIESAYTTSSCRVGQSCYVHWVYVAKNPNTSVYGVFLTMSITARDAAGNVIGSEDSVVADIPPGATYAMASQLSATSLPARVEVVSTTSAWATAPAGPDHYPPFAVTGVSFAPSSIGGYQVNGTVQSPYKRDADQMNVTVLLRDEAGKLLAGDKTFISGLPANGTRPFSIKSWDDEMPKPAKVDVVAYPWSTPNWIDIAG